MDDNEAKFLIDQFNKYASWAVRRGEVRFPFYAVIVATIAFWVTFQPNLLPEKLAWEISSAVIGGIGGLAAGAYLRQQREYSILRERLILLDIYRRRSSLPDRLNLAQVILTEEEIPFRLVIDNLLAEEKRTAQGKPRTATGVGYENGLYNRWSWFHRLGADLFDGNTLVIANVLWHPITTRRFERRSRNRWFNAWCWRIYDGLVSVVEVWW